MACHAPPPPPRSVAYVRVSPVWPPPWHAQVTWLGQQSIARSAGAFMYSSNVAEGNETLSGYQFISDSTVLTTPGQHLVQGMAT